MTPSIQEMHPRRLEEGQGWSFIIYVRLMGSGFAYGPLMLTGIAAEIPAESHEITRNSERNATTIPKQKPHPIN